MNNPENGSPVEADTVGPLIDRLGLERTSELREAADVLTAALKDASVTAADRTEAWREYSTVAETAVERSTDYGRAQIAALIHKAEIFKRADDPDRYVAELDSAEVYAFNAGLFDVSDVLAAEIEAVGGGLELSPDLFVVRLRGAVDEPNREFLRELAGDGTTLEDLIGDAYGMILETGADPDETLRALGVIE